MFLVVLPLISLCLVAHFCNFIYVTSIPHFNLTLHACDFFNKIYFCYFVSNVLEWTLVIHRSSQSARVLPGNAELPPGCFSCNKTTAYTNLKRHCYGEGFHLKELNTYRNSDGLFHKINLNASHTKGIYSHCMAALMGLSESWSSCKTWLLAPVYLVRIFNQTHNSERSGALCLRRQQRGFKYFLVSLMEIEIPLFRRRDTMTEKQSMHLNSARLDSKVGHIYIQGMGWGCW